MSIFVKQEETRSTLQQEIAAELQEKARKRAAEADRPDGVKDSRYIEGTKRTTKFAWIWAVVVAAVIVLVVYVIIRSA